MVFLLSFIVERWNGFDGHRDEKSPEEGEASCVNRTGGEDRTEGTTVTAGNRGDGP